MKSRVNLLRRTIIVGLTAATLASTGLTAMANPVEIIPESQAAYWENVMASIPGQKVGISDFFLGDSITTPEVELKGEIPAEPVVKAANADGGVNLTWGTVSGAERYAVYKKEGSAAWTLLSSSVSASATSYKVTGLTPGKSYKFTVRAVNSEGISGFTPTAAMTYLPRTTVSLSVAENAVNVSWTSITGAAQYQVYRKVSGGSWTLLDVVGSNVLSFADTNAESGNTYYYAVRGVARDNSRSDYAANYSIYYLAMPNLKISNSGTTVKLAWSKINGAKEYQVYRKESGGSWTLLDTVNSSATSYSDATAKIGTTYYYTVRAKNGTNRSDFVASSAVNLLKIPEFTSVVAENSVKVSWSKVDKATEYDVYRRTASDGWTKIATTASLEYADKSAVSGTTYYYTVRAKNNSCVSDFKTGTAVKYLSMPAVGVLPTIDGNIVSWKAVNGADTYEVYRRPAGGSWTKIADTTSVIYTDETAKTGETYYYTVRAKNGSSRSDFKASDKVLVPTAPKVSKVTNAVDGVKVTWNKIPEAEGYYVYRKSEAEPGWKEVGRTVGAESVSFTDTNVVSGTKYTYTVRSCYGYVRSTFYSGSSVYYLETPDFTVVESEYNNSDFGRSADIIFDYDIVEGATLYYVYRRTAGESWQLLGYTDAVISWGYIDYGVQKGKTYYYAVRAVNEYGMSDFKTISFYSENGRTTSFPVLSVVTDSEGKTYVTWEKAKDVNTYVMLCRNGFPESLEPYAIVYNNGGSGTESVLIDDVGKYTDIDLYIEYMDGSDDFTGISLKNYK